MRRLLLLLPTALLAACGNDVQVAKGSTCNGEADGGETSVDSSYDADEDGYFDAGNPDCVATYDASQLDCDDHAPDIHPKQGEILCNAADDDCDPATLDSDDADADGADSCDDCNDLDATVGPAVAEVSCNLVDDDCNPATPDAADADSDGVDACTDCNDGNGAVNPSVVEQTCNGLDDDCNPETIDTPDADDDGAGLCSGDCNDADPTRSPLLPEVCGNTIDDDCDGQTDEDCVIDYNGTWTMDDTVVYNCARSNVDIDFSQFLIAGTESATSVTPLGSAHQPGRMSGAFSSATALDVSVTYSGGCTEDYYLDVVFSDANHFSGTFLAQYTPRSSGACSDCANQTWSVSGYR